MKTKKGFTLIELLVVVLIIGILVAIALPKYKLAVAKSRYTTLMNLARSIKEAQEIYFLANGKYATNFAELDISLPGNYTIIGTGGSASDETTGDFMYLYGEANRVGIGNYTSLCNTYEIYLNNIQSNSVTIPNRSFCYADPGSGCDLALGHAVCRSFSKKPSGDRDTYSYWLD